MACHAARVAKTWIDSRRVGPGDTFVALRGQRADGHRFVGAALDAGAARVVVRPDYPGDDDARILRAVRPRRWLWDAATDHRVRLAEAGCRVLAVLGSNGKTGTRRLLHHVLASAGLRGSQAEASFNNDLGVPLTLLNAEPEHAYVALEIGTNGRGEVAALAGLARPDAAVLVSIGEEHLQGLGDLQGVAREEAGFYRHVRAGGLVVASAAAAEATAPWYDVAEGVTLVPLDGDVGVPVDFPLLGQKQRENAALVVVLARWMGVPEDRIRVGLRSAPPAPGRLERRDLPGGGVVIDDSYNANPASMAEALAVLAAWPVPPGGRRVAVLGGMRELGSASASRHAAVAAAASAVADRLLLIGEGWGRDEEVVSRGTAGSMLHGLGPGDVVLLKGSRAEHLERLLP